MISGKFLDGINLSNDAYLLELILPKATNLLEKTNEVINQYVDLLCDM
jgi:hypothetical protein